MEVDDIKTFLETVPPGKTYKITNFKPTRLNQYQNNYIVFPELTLHCSNDECRGPRFYTSNENINIESKTNSTLDKFVVFMCKNCNQSFKTYAIRLSIGQRLEDLSIFKYAEEPQFGPPIPSKIYKLIGEERNLYILGTRCENQGMGIGAFVYYRRVLENQKNRIFDEIIRVVSKVSPSSTDLLSELESAKGETQFSKAIDNIKHAIPESLMINGHNPLKLLHTALSQGVHEHTDDECLELAGSVRTVLTEFSERLDSALKEEATLTSAIKLLAKKAQK